MQKVFDCLSDKKNSHASALERLRAQLDKHPEVAIDDYRDRSGKTLLIAAAAAGSEEVVSYLLERGADGNVTDARGWTALHYSAAYCKPQVCMLLLREPSIDVDKAHDGGGSVLSIAAQAGLGRVVKCLIEMGADIDKKNVLGFTPLTMSIDGGHPGIAKMLMEAGAEVDYSDNFIGITPLHLAVYLGDDQTIEEILHRLNDDTGRKTRCINLRTKFGLTNLHRAVGNGHLTTVRLLLEHGADPNAREGRKRNLSILKSLTRAAYSHRAIDPQHPGFQSLMVSLLVNRSPHDSMDSLGEGATSLHYAARAGDSEMIKVLLAAGADPRLKIKKSKLTAVDFAIKHDRTAAIKAFADHLGSCPDKEID